MIGCGAAFGQGRLKIGERYFERIEHGHHARGGVFQLFANRAFQHAHIDDVFRFGNTGAFGKQAQAFGRVAAAAHTGNRRHTRIVPAGNVAV